MAGRTPILPPIAPHATAPSSEASRPPHQSQSALKVRRKPLPRLAACARPEPLGQVRVALGDAPVRVQANKQGAWLDVELVAVSASVQVANALGAGASISPGAQGKGPQGDTAAAGGTIAALRCVADARGAGHAPERAAAVVTMDEPAPVVHVGAFRCRVEQLIPPHVINADTKEPPPPRLTAVVAVDVPDAMSAPRSGFVSDDDGDCDSNSMDDGRARVDHLAKADEEMRAWMSTHRPASAVLELCGDDGVDADDVLDLRLRIVPVHRNAVGSSWPFLGAVDVMRMGMTLDGEDIEAHTCVPLHAGACVRAGDYSVQILAVVGSSSTSGVVADTGDGDDPSGVSGHGAVLVSDDSLPSFAAHVCIKRHDADEDAADALDRLLGL